MSEKLFEVTEDHLETGMRGYPIGYCVTSTVNPEKGLYYMGQPVTELSNNKPEEVIFLLQNGRLPSQEEFIEFEKDLVSVGKCDKGLVDAIYALPKAHPMINFSIALLLTGHFHGQDDYRKDYKSLIALLPEISAHVINRHNDRPPAQSNPELGYMENFVHMICEDKSKIADWIPIFSLFNILHYDHGGGNLSAFVGKAVSSGLEDLWGSVSSAMNALAGPRHGRANQDCLAFVKQMLDKHGCDIQDEDLAKVIQNMLDNKELIYGFGHAVLRVEDPRASIFYKVAQQHYADNSLIKMALKLRKVVPQVLLKNPKIANPYPNIDAISGALLAASGFNYPELYTVLFGLSRCIGIGRQIIYERFEARNGKGTPIVRPRYIYKSLQA